MPCDWLLCGVVSSSGSLSLALALREVNQEDPGEASEHHSQAAAAGGEATQIPSSRDRHAAGPLVHHQTTEPAPSSTLCCTAGSAAPPSYSQVPPQCYQAEDRAQHPDPKEAALSAFVPLAVPSRRVERE